MITSLRPMLIVGAAVALIAGLTGCSAGDAVDKNPASNEQPATSQNDPGEGKDGRAFDSTDDAVITAVLAALSDADRAEWEGSSLKVYFNEGSVNDPVADIGCLAVQTLLADDETGFMVYSDGEIDCSTKH